MTDVDEGTETKFGVRASTTFVGATQALVSLTPTKNGSAAFLAVADTETIPPATAAETLLAYREIDFSGTSPQIIQFALSISATQDATSKEVSGDTAAVLQPSTAYKIVMYHSGSDTILLSFMTLGSVDEGYTFGGSNSGHTFDMSAHNFRTGTDGKFQVPFVFSWLQNSGLIASPSIKVEGGTIFNAIGNFEFSGSDGVITRYNNLANHFGDPSRGIIFLHTPFSNTILKYKITLTNNVGNGFSIIYNEG
ncbi:hypothetical protein P0082_07555 [Candidatus Haliotispira prima]|uniref:Uncharacterized protein n=1 Tax=Candidatus Haliotispira prima TaxID=3034016 RepID=A0ABY8MEP6_9SPIO|nr:hypothetical protein P0082_07555 [Candidatus Haliotispira prima]